MPIELLVMAASGVAVDAVVAVVGVASTVVSGLVASRGIRFVVDQVKATEYVERYTDGERWLDSRDYPAGDWSMLDLDAAAASGMPGAAIEYERRLELQREAYEKDEAERRD